MNKLSFFKRLLILITAAAALLALACCAPGSRQEVKLDSKNPVTISVWHYYNGAILNAFDSLVKEFNETVGLEMGIIVEGFGMGNVSELESAVIASANKEVGSMDMPNIFASYADTAYAAEKMGLLANLNDYFAEDEQKEYIDSYIEEGKIGLDGELRIFPIAKSTEILMINETDWQPFADANGLDYDDLATIEGIARVAELYYDWTDAKTPSIANDGKAFYGRDAMANLFILASKEFGTEIFEVENGAAKLNVDESVMRKIWDYYYIPYISGHFASYGRYRSDDAKVGDILAYVGSTSSVSYFPTEVTSDGRVYPVSAKALAAPGFEGGRSVMIQQGAGMVVTKATVEQEYASIVFLKWFTQQHNNIEFSALSGYMPVKKDANDFDTYMDVLNDTGITLDQVTNDTLEIAFNGVQTSEMYTSRAFDGGAAARSVLEYNLQDKAEADRDTVLRIIENGASREDAIALFDNEQNFQDWLSGFTSALNRAIGK